jgi:hypothetical protein
MRASVRLADYSGLGDSPLAVMPAIPGRCSYQISPHQFNSEVVFLWSNSVRFTDESSTAEPKLLARTSLAACPFLPFGALLLCGPVFPMGFGAASRIPNCSELNKPPDPPPRNPSENMTSHHLAVFSLAGTTRKDAVSLCCEWRLSLGFRPN